MGIATKNSILLVDYAIIAQNRGLARFEAIIDSCRKRARPRRSGSFQSGLLGNAQHIPERYAVLASGALAIVILR